MAKVEQPIFVLPKKRSVKKNSSIFGHVDHIITVQGADSESTKYKNGLSPVNEHVVNGIIHSTMEGSNSNIKMNLPIIPQHDEPQKPTFHPVSSVHCSREIIDLSPIYENSSDACSSHDDLQVSNENDMKKSCKVLNSENNESSSATPNSLSQTQSENSFEMGPFTDSLKNSAKRKKRVNIVPEVYEIDNYDTEITALHVDSKDSIGNDCSDSSRDNYLTITGTIKRGKKKGQNIDVKLNISREELEMIERSIIVEEHNKMDVSTCSLYNGLHVFIVGLICSPVVCCVSALFSFFMGTKTWYNILNHVIEESTCVKKVVLAPLLILSYPFIIVICAVGLGLYAAVVQLSFSGRNWRKEISDLEKGFYSWLCDTLRLSHCSPYEVIILTDVKS